MDVSNFVLVTVTNYGYKKYTENAVKSLIQSGFSLKHVIIYAMDPQCAEYFKNNYNEIRVKRTDYENNVTVSYMEGEWNNVTLQKINIVHNELKEHSYVVLFDGDIVFNSSNFIEHIQTEMNKNNDIELLGQHEFKNNETRQLCSGFYCVKSTPSTLKYFDPSNYINGKFKRNDQDYLNKIRKHIKWKFLDIDLFPNGFYYYHHHKNRESAYIVHFNFLKYKEKEGRMKRYKLWYL